MQMGLFYEPTLQPNRKPQSYRVAPTGGRAVAFSGWLVLEEDDYGCPAGGWITHTVSREYMTDRGGFVFEEERHEAHADCSGEHLVFRGVELQEAAQQ